MPTLKQLPIDNIFTKRIPVKQTHSLKRGQVEIKEEKKTHKEKPDSFSFCNCTAFICKEKRKFLNYTVDKLDAPKVMQT